MLLISFLGILLLSLTHLFVNKLQLSQLPRSKWLSFAGGISVTYIFIEAIPELQEFQEKVHSGEGSVFGGTFFEGTGIYLVALMGLVMFYGLENWASKSSKSRREPKEGEEREVKGIFWIHLGSFTVYNFLIGYLLLNKERESLKSLLLYSVAMAFHLVVTDHGLADHFREEYRKKGRWILVAAVFCGWLMSIFITISEITIALIFSFVAGGIIMNVMKEELPKERDSNFFAFLSGTVAYGVFLTAV